MVLVQGVGCLLLAACSEQAPVRVLEDRTCATHHGSHLNIDQFKNPTRGRIVKLVQGVGFEPTKA